MDQSTEAEVPIRHKVFELDLVLEEDIQAELEYFATRARLGFVPETYEFLETVLLDHLSISPVLEEVISFLITRANWKAINSIAASMTEKWWDIRLDRSVAEALDRWLVAPDRIPPFAPLQHDVTIQLHQMDSSKVSSWILATRLNLATSFAFGTFPHWSHRPGKGEFMLLAGKIADHPWEITQMFRELCWFRIKQAMNLSRFLDASRLEITDTEDLYVELISWFTPADNDDEIQEETLLDQRTCLINIHYSWLQYTFAFSSGTGFRESLDSCWQPEDWRATLGASTRKDFFETLSRCVASEPTSRLNNPEILAMGFYQMCPEDRARVSTICHEIMSLMTAVCDQLPQIQLGGEIWDFCQAVDRLFDERYRYPRLYVPYRLRDAENVNEATGQSRATLSRGPEPRRRAAYPLRSSLLPPALGSRSLYPDRSRSELSRSVLSTWAAREDSTRQHWQS